MSKIIVCVGLPGSGKTTFAKNWVNESPENRIRFNNDDQLKMMNNGIYSTEQYLIIREIQDEFINQSLIWDKELVIDNTNLSTSSFSHLMNMIVSKIATLGLQQTYEIIIKDFTDVDIDTCLERNKNSNSLIPEKSIYKMSKNINKIKLLIDSTIEVNDNIKLEKV